MDRLAREGVPERVVGGVGAEHVGDDRFARGGVQLVGRAFEHLLEQPVIDGDAARRDEAQHPLGRLAQALVAGEQQFPKGLRQVFAGAEVVDADELLDEERNALAQRVHTIDRVDVGGAAQDLLRLRRDLRAVEPGELPARHPAGALELREVGAQRMPAQHLVAAIAEEEQEAAARDHPDDESHQFERGRVGPVQVFDHHDERLRRRDVLEQHRDQLVEPLGARSGRNLGPEAQLGQQHREHAAPGPRSFDDGVEADLVDQLPENAGERRIWSTVGAEIDAAPGDDDGRSRCLRPEFVEQSGLADARLAADHHDPRLAGYDLLQLLAQGDEIGLTPDHGSAGRR